MIKDKCYQFQLSVHVSNGCNYEYRCVCVCVFYSYLWLIRHKNVANLPTKKIAPHPNSCFSHAVPEIFFLLAWMCGVFLFLGSHICFLVFLHLSVSFTPLAEGRLEVNMTEVSLEDVERSLLEKEPSIAPGGYWKPKDCLPRWKVSADETLFGQRHRGIHRRMREDT